MNSEQKEMLWGLLMVFFAIASVGCTPIYEYLDYTNRLPTAILLLATLTLCYAISAYKLITID